MKHKFKVGDKVVCIDDSESDVLKVGKVYKVISVHHYPNTKPFLHLKGLPEAQNGWYASRFDISVGGALTAIIRRTRNGGFRVNLVGANGEKMFTSEVYTTKAAAKKTLRHFPDFEIVDETK